MRRPVHTQLGLRARAAFQRSVDPSAVEGGAMLDLLVTTYLGTRECIGSGLRQVAGALLPGWLRPQPYDWRSFAGKVGWPANGAGAAPPRDPWRRTLETNCWSQRLQVCVVTGGATGIGYAIAEALAGAGAHVILACRPQDGADRACQVGQLALPARPRPPRSRLVAAAVAAADAC
jgi:hypothetical protein